MDYNIITLEECMEMHEEKGMAAVIEGGAVTGFVEE